MAGPACIIPRQSVELYTLCRSAAGRRRWCFSASCGASTKPSRAQPGACIKAGLDIQGYPVGDPVLPQAALTSEQRKVVETSLRMSLDTLVMPGLDPGIHVFLLQVVRTWMAGT